MKLKLFVAGILAVDGALAASLGHNHDSKHRHDLHFSQIDGQS